MRELQVPKEFSRLGGIVEISLENDLQRFSLALGRTLKLGESLSTPLTYENSLRKTS